MKASHKLVSTRDGTSWWLTTDGPACYYKRCGDQGAGWSRSVYTLEHYINHHSFTCEKLTAFKGNK